MTPRVQTMLICTALTILCAQACRGELTRDPRVAAARHLGKLFVGNDVNVTGQDAATSIPLPNGDAFWVFGDTIEGPFKSIRGLPLADKLSSTAALVPPQAIEAGIQRYQFLKQPGGRRPSEVVPFSEGEERDTHRLWPMHGIAVGDQLTIFYHHISLLPGVDVFENFKLEGMGIAQAKIGEWKFNRLIAADGTREFWKGEQPSFGVFITPRQELAYVWGSLMTGMFLARTRIEKVAEQASYQYLIVAPAQDQPDRAPVWSNRFAATAPLFDSVPNELSVAYNRYLGCYVAIHTYLREHKIVMRTAPDVIGPWTAPQVIFEPPRIKTDDLIYAAKEHPELSRENGRKIYVTYVNSTYYVPELVEITFK